MNLYSAYSAYCESHIMSRKKLYYRRKLLLPDIVNQGKEKVWNMTDLIISDCRESTSCSVQTTHWSRCRRRYRGLEEQRSESMIRWISCFNKVSDTSQHCLTTTSRDWTADCQIDRWMVINTCLNWRSWWWRMDRMQSGDFTSTRCWQNSPLSLIISSVIWLWFCVLRYDSFLVIFTLWFSEYFSS